MKKHEALFTRDGLNRAVTSFLTLLRALEPEFVSHLESEEVEPNSWVPAWMQTLLAGQLARPLLLRLWDTYFASSEVSKLRRVFFFFRAMSHVAKSNRGCTQGLDLHTYVCLAVVTWMRDELLDQEGPDISGQFAQSVYGSCAVHLTETPELSFCPNSTCSYCSVPRISPELAVDDVHGPDHHSRP